MPCHSTGTWPQGSTWGDPRGSLWVGKVLLCVACAVPVGGRRDPEYDQLKAELYELGDYVAVSTSTFMSAVVDLVVCYAPQASLPRPLIPDSRLDVVNVGNAHLVCVTSEQALEGALRVAHRGRRGARRGPSRCGFRGRGSRGCACR